MHINKPIFYGSWCSFKLKNILTITPASKRIKMTRLIKELGCLRESLKTMCDRNLESFYHKE